MFGLLFPSKVLLDRLPEFVVRVVHEFLRYFCLVSLPIMLRHLVMINFITGQKYLNSHSTSLPPILKIKQSQVTSLGVLLHPLEE